VAASLWLWRSFSTSEELGEKMLRAFCQW